jgi:predicted lysophospholipase L1 biosynthesis ABC-type transport system permease subunit
MKKALIFAATLLTSTALAAPSFAQSPIPDYQAAPRKEARDTREGPTVNQLTAIDDARVARLKADLHLTSNQEGYWGKLESALKDISKRRADRVITRWNSERDARDRDADDKRAEPATPMERMRRAAEGMNLQAADLKSVADASEPLYGKLDEQQRRILDGALREQLVRPAALDEGRRSRRSAEW